MAVELCKVNLWMEAMEPGKPLTFLEHRIQCGNSLLGTTPGLLAQGIPDDAFKPIESDDKALAAALRRRNKTERQEQMSLILGAGAATDRLTEAVASLDAMDDASIASYTVRKRPMGNWPSRRRIATPGLSQMPGVPPLSGRRFRARQSL
jgi:hypothetical protein